MNDFPRNGRLGQGNVEDDSGTIDSMPSFGMGELDSEHGVVLKDWTAQDFANIYVRFRPHLISHARKFIREESQAEEVVQDAFLYLMTALPDLDSELGVLKFLKWKTRLLCLDVIRAQGANPIFGASLLEDATPSSSADLTESIERADDAAIVRLALAQLSPRHREALVATVFEEKSTQQVAKEMGLSENAFRQLLLRARRTFKTVFVGEADAANMSVSQALNLAAKRHRLKLISGSSLILVLGAAFAAPWGNSGQQPFTVISTEVAKLELGVESESLAGEGPSDSDFDGGQQEELLRGQAKVILPEASPAETAEFNALVSVDSVGGSGLIDEPMTAGPDIVDDSNQGELRTLLASQIADNPLLVSAKGATITSRSPDELVIRQAVSENLTLIVHVAQCGDSSGSRPCKIYFEDSRNGNNLIWLAQTHASEQMRRDNEVPALDVVATDFLVGDFGGSYGNVAINALGESSLEYLRFELTIDGPATELLNVKLVKSAA